MFISKDRIRRHLKDTANTWAITIGSGHSEVTSLAPAWAPRVADDPEVLAIFTAISDKVHSMVNVGSTSRTTDDSALVKHEGAWACSDCNRDWLVLQSSNVTIDISALNWFIRLDFRNSFLLVILAATLLSCVRIAITVHVLKVLQIFEGVSHQATSATCVAIAACAI